MFLKIIKFTDKTIAKVCIGFIKVYQKTISPDHSALGKNKPFSGCKFYPSCSQYAILTFQKKGFVVGVPKVLGRVLRCHPWQKGGIDNP